MTILDWIACAFVIALLLVMIAICAGWTGGMVLLAMGRERVDRLVRLVARKRI